MVASNFKKTITLTSFILLITIFLIYTGGYFNQKDIKKGTSTSIRHKENSDLIRHSSKNSMTEINKIEGHENEINEIVEVKKTKNKIRQIEQITIDEPDFIDSNLTLQQRDSLDSVNLVDEKIRMFSSKSISMPLKMKFPSSMFREIKVKPTKKKK